MNALDWVGAMRVARLVCAHYFRGADLDDAVQVTMLTLVRRAGARWDPQRGEWLGWVSQCARARCMDRIRITAGVTRSGYERRRPVEIELLDDDHYPCTNDQHDAAELPDEFMRCLSPRERFIIEAVFVQGIRQRDVARRLECSESMISLIIRHIGERVGHRLLHRSAA